MTAYGFKARFCEPIATGTKGGTIRAPRKDGRLIPVGGMIQFYTAMRTRQCRKIMPDRRCLEVQPIRLGFGGRVVRVGPRLCFSTARELDAFAVFDGFGDWPDLREFWREEHAGHLLFDGFHIRWLPWPTALAEDAA
jgi:hypothetical protein